MTASRLSVLGSATLSGGTVSLTSRGEVGIPIGTTYTVMSASGAITGIFGNLRTDLRGTLTAELSYDPTDVLLTVERTLPSLAQLATTPNEQGVAEALSTMPVSADGSIVAKVLARLPTDEVKRALSQTNGEALADAQSTARQKNNGTLTTIRGRLESTTPGSNVDADLGPLSTAGGPSAKALLAGLGSAVSAAMGSPDAYSLTTARATGSRGIWAQGLGLHGIVDPDGNALGVDYTSSGLTLGYDRALSRRMVVGGSVGYSTTEFRSQGRIDTTDSRETPLSAYGSYTCANAYVMGIISYTWDRYDASRRILIGPLDRIAESSFHGHDVMAYLEGGWPRKLGRTEVSPLLSLQYNHMAQESFTEKGAGSLDLSVDDAAVSSTLASLGEEVSRTYLRNGKHSVRPQLRARYSRDLQGDSPAIVAQFAGNPGRAFRVMGNDLGRDFWFLGAGLESHLKGRATLQVNYDRQMSRGQFVNAGELGIRVQF